MRGKKLGRFLGAFVAVALAVGATSQAAFAGGAHSGKTPPDVPGFNGSTIKLGVISPLSGLFAACGKPLTEGNRVYWEAKNAKDGVAGKYKVELSVEDSQYQVEAALQGYDKLKGDVVAFQQILGTQIVQSVNTRLKADNTYGGPASLEGLWVNLDSGDRGGAVAVPVRGNLNPATFLPGSSKNDNEFFIARLGVNWKFGL